VVRRAGGSGGVGDYDPGKKINRHNRQIFVDAIGLMAHGPEYHAFLARHRRHSDESMDQTLTGCLGGNRSVYYAETRGVLLKSAL
jgi:hypothetical protein